MTTFQIESVFDKKIDTCEYGMCNQSGRLSNGDDCLCKVERRAIDHGEAMSDLERGN